MNGLSVVIPVIRPQNLERIRRALDGQWKPMEILWEEDVERIGCPRMVKRLVDKTSHDWVMFLGDDTIPQPGMVAEAFAAAEEKLPDGWGLVGINDGHNEGSLLATHWMAHKNLLQMLGGEFFHTGYRHGYCDHELTARCAAAERYVYAAAAKLIHDHPFFNQETLTGDYRRVYTGATYIHDLTLFRRRERRGWISN